MRINYVELRNFRIFSDFRCEFGDKTLLLGRNGSGKTTIIESLYYCSVFSPLRSFETDRDLVRVSENFFNLKLNFLDDYGYKHDIFVAYEINENKPKKKIKFDDKTTNIVSASGKLKVVPFLIEDFQLVFGSPSWRRNTINKILFSVSESYYGDLINYSKMIKRKNALIKMINEKKNEGEGNGAIEDMISLLKNYNETLAKHAVELTLKRSELVSYVNEFMQKEGLPFELSVKYKSNILDVIKNSSDPVSDLKNYLSANLEKELTYGKSIIGPHLDDVVLYTRGNKAARVFLSQGQVRMVSILFKLSLVKYIEAKTKQVPVLLFDDVIGELDEKNRKLVFDKLLALGDMQVIVASSEIDENAFGGFNIIKLSD